MIQRIIAATVIALFVMASLSFSEAKPVNAGLPLVRTDLPAWKPASPSDDFLFSPCPIQRRNFLRRQQRSA